MISARKPENESERLNTLRGYEVLDTQPDYAFDAMTNVAASICEVPIALVSLIDDNRQWFKSQCGLPGTSQTARDISFCAHAILQRDIFEVPDATKDPRFADNPLVTGDPHIRFYAGAPLITADGLALGTLCVIDRKPKTLTQTQRVQLKHLAQSVIGLIVMRIRRSEMEELKLAIAQNDASSSRLKKHAKELNALASRISVV